MTLPEIQQLTVEIVATAFLLAFSVSLLGAFFAPQSRTDRL